MKSKIFHALCLLACCLLSPDIAAAELSMINQWRIEQAIDRCQRTDNTLIFPEYWGTTVTDENRETVCMAEQFARLAALEGDGWLKNKALEFINQCKTESEGNDTQYYTCLQAGLTKVTKELSSSCEELGEAGLWDGNRCRRLVSYIFIKDFDKVMQSNRPIVEKMMDSKTLKLLFSPIAAIILLLLYVLDVVLLTDLGNWWRIPKFGFLVGSVILGSWFLHGELHFAGMGAAVLICVGGIILNHIMVKSKSDKK
ncbi:MAG: hypothetical protein KAR32_00215 [Candidatus Omnitrophica bacterium]|nr:hypothetical protein [Candidatus Omnitrophota bacterium]